jgi:hypothetical protein
VTLETDIRVVLHSQANAMDVPEPHLSRAVLLAPVVPQRRRRNLVATKGTDVSLNTQPNEGGSRRRIALLVAAVVGVIGATGIALAISNASSDDAQTPSAAAATTVPPTMTVAPTTTGAETETLRVAVTSASIPVTFTVPEGWVVESSHVYLPSIGGVVIDEIANIYSDGCQWKLADPPLGPTVGDLVEAWATVPDVAATDPVEVTVDGYAGKQIEFTVRDYNVGECKENTVALWYSPGDAVVGFHTEGPNQHLQQRILDVNGTRLNISAYYLPGASPKQRAALDEILASIQIG